MSLDGRFPPENNVVLQYSKASLLFVYSILEDSLKDTCDDRMMAVASVGLLSAHRRRLQLVRDLGRARRAHSLQPACGPAPSPHAGNELATAAEIAGSFGPGF